MHNYCDNDAKQQTWHNIHGMMIAVIPKAEFLFETNLSLLATGDWRHKINHSPPGSAVIL